VLGVSAESPPPTATVLSSSSPSGESHSGSAPSRRCLEHEMHVSITSQPSLGSCDEEGAGSTGLYTEGELAGAPVR
jgi:hypothetical protein